ncbi:MAG: hypothetical protein C0501_02565 [Isosphaera sp.]|nr:hypothetical protein [Isosphaera sp.]
MTIQEMADQVLADRKQAWAKDDPRVAIVSTQSLGPDDERAVRRVVAAAGYVGAEQDEMVRQVSTRVVGRVAALADHLPADGGD